MAAMTERLIEAALVLGGHLLSSLPPATRAPSRCTPPIRSSNVFIAKKLYYDPQVRFRNLMWGQVFCVMLRRQARWPILTMRQSISVILRRPRITRRSPATCAAMRGPRRMRPRIAARSRAALSGAVGLRGSPSRKRPARAPQADGKIEVLAAVGRLDPIETSFLQTTPRGVCSAGSSPVRAMVCPDPLAARSCAASCARSPRMTIGAWAILDARRPGVVDDLVKNRQNKRHGARSLRKLVSMGQVGRLPQAPQFSRQP